MMQRIFSRGSSALYSKFSSGRLTAAPAPDFSSRITGQVSQTLRSVLQAKGVETPVFGSFNEAEEEKVARLSGPSIVDAAMALGAAGPGDAVFLSCTNLRTLDVIGPLEERLGKPVLSSNQVLAWHMMQQAGGLAPSLSVGRLMEQA